MSVDHSGFRYAAALNARNMLLWHLKVAKDSRDRTVIVKFNGRESISLKLCLLQRPSSTNHHNTTTAGHHTINRTPNLFFCRKFNAPPYYPRTCSYHQQTLPHHVLHPALPARPSCSWYSRQFLGDAVRRAINPWHRGSSPFCAVVPGAIDVNRRCHDWGYRQQRDTRRDSRQINEHACSCSRTPLLHYCSRRQPIHRDAPIFLPPTGKVHGRGRSPFPNNSRTVRHCR